MPARDPKTSESVPWSVGWGGAREGAGRPKGAGLKSPEQRRDKRLGFLLTAEELDKARELAARAGTTPQKLARQLLLSALEQDD